jgi:hypothetical protein
MTKRKYHDTVREVYGDGPLRYFAEELYKCGFRRFKGDSEALKCRRGKTEASVIRYRWGKKKMIQVMWTARDETNREYYHNSIAFAECLAHPILWHIVRTISEATR